MSIFVEKAHLSPFADTRQPRHAAKQHHIEQCRACQCCMLACSYHHRRAFSPAFSSIWVTRNNLTGIVEWSIDSTCDDCAGEPEQLCAKYCAYGVLTIGPAEMQPGPAEPAPGGEEAR
jgi:Fe-S-cluster-containing dehydrogenase component